VVVTRQYRRKPAPTHAQKTDMQSQAQLVRITPARVDGLTLGAIEGEKRRHLEVADIAGQLAHPQKRRLPALHRELYQWEVTIPFWNVNRKMNRKVNGINDLPTSTPRQRWVCEPPVIALKTT
jgi:hypothetical protein